jgi:methylglutamate dehydrogenase subunit D
VTEFAFACRDNFGMAAILARRGISSDRIGAALGLEAPTAPGRRLASDGLSLIGSAAGSWLAHLDNAPPLWADELRARLDGLASVSDQSGAYVLFQLTGKGARTILQRGAAVDFDPTVFGAGAALTVIAHMSVVVWATDDGRGYDVAVYRSFAESFREWLEVSAAAL